MVLKLILMRHAKSDWGDGTLTDIDRPLNARGRRDAPRIGAWLKDRGHLPLSASVSAARRTRETWEALPAVTGPALLELSERLYNAGAETILAHARAAPSECHLILAHNPGIGEAAQRLVRQAPRHPRCADYPTAATLVLEIDGSDWGALRWGAGRVLDFVVPRDLGEEGAPPG